MKTKIDQVGQAVEWTNPPPLETKTQVFLKQLRKRRGKWAIFPYGTNSTDLIRVYGVEAVQRTVSTNGRFFKATFVRFP